MIVAESRGIPFDLDRDKRFSPNFRRGMDAWDAIKDVAEALKMGRDEYLRSLPKLGRTGEMKEHLRKLLAEVGE